MRPQSYFSAYKFIIFSRAARIIKVLSKNVRKTWLYATKFNTKITVRKKREWPESVVASSETPEA